MQQGLAFKQAPRKVAPPFDTRISAISVMGSMTVAGDGSCDVSSSCTGGTIPVALRTTRVTLEEVVLVTLGEETVPIIAGGEDNRHIYRGHRRLGGR